MSLSRSIRRAAGLRTAALCAMASLLLGATLPAAAIDIPVDVLDDPVPNGCTTGSCSLREAVTLANALAGPDRILLPATPGLPLQLSIPGSGETANATGDLNVRDELEIVGTGVNTTILVQTAQDRVFQTTMAGDKKLTLRGLTIEGGNSGVGGALLSGSLVTIEDAALIGNQATFEGGAIDHSAGYAPQITEPRLVLRRVTFRDNVVTQTSGTGQGGAIYANVTLQGAPYLLAEDCVFDNNQSKSGGGAILLNGSPSQFGGIAVIRRSTFSGNRTGASGGAAIYVPSFTSYVVNVADSVFENNVTTSSDDAAGGAVQLSRVTSAEVVRTTFSGNRGNRGGAINAYFPLQIFDSHFFDNSASFRGGAVSGGATLLVDRSTFESNNVTTTDGNQDGGGAVAFAGDAVTFQRSTFSDNDAYRGGAISLVEGIMQLYGSTVVAPAQGIAGRAGTALRIRDDTTASLGIANSILAGSCLFPSAGRQLAVAYNNIESGTSCRFGTAALSSLNQSSATSAQIKLDALADNGGPTSTRLPLAGSIAINQGRANYCTATDQRHFVRVDQQCDIGAVEVGATMDIIFSDGFDRMF